MAARPVTAPIPPRWIFHGHPIAEAPADNLLDKLCYWASRDLRGRSVFGRVDLTYLGAIPYGQPPYRKIKPGRKVRVRWQEPPL